MEYDYIIIGAGPSGLTTAWLLSKQNKKCLLIDRETTIGGCHRVTRENGYFSEHGPRVYLSNYVNTKAILKDMDINFDDIFTHMPMSFSNIGNFDIKKIPIIDILKVIMTFIVFLIYPGFSKNITVKEFYDKLNFNPLVKVYFDRICRTTDGMGADRYTLYEFFNLINQNVLIKYYQPKEPNDILLFPKIKSSLDKTHLIDFKLGTEITKISFNGNEIKDVVTKSGEKFKGKKYILAVPPKNMFAIMPPKAFPVDQKMIDAMSYNTYINVTFHWNKDLKLKPLMGFGLTSWGLAFFILSDYMKFKTSKTVISSSISILDQPSDYTKKTANQSSKKELVLEAFRQLKESYPDLPNPDYVTMDDLEYKDNQWTTDDGGYVLNKEQYTIDFKSPVYNNLFTIGAHNGYADIAFTTFESAVTNSIVFCNRYESSKFPLKSIITLRQIIIIVILVIVLIYLGYYHYKSV